MTEQLLIRAEGVTIHGAPLNGAPPRGGIYVTKDGFGGWEDTTDPRGESVPRPSEHGDFDFDVFHTPRVVPIEGVILAPNPELLKNYRDHLAAIGTAGRRFRVTVTLQGETTWAWARRGMLRVRDAGIRHGWHRATFTWQFVCRDPRRFGDVEPFSTGQVAINRGNFPAWPVFTVSGTAPGYTITGPGGQRIVVTRALVAGQPHRIDTSTGGLVINGVRVEGGVSVWEPWTIDPGLPGVAHAISAGALVTEVTATFM